ncbi:amidase, partial [Streptococcus canis]
MKKAVYFKILLPLVSLGFLISLGITILAGVLGAVGGSPSNCTTEVVTST